MPASSLVATYAASVSPAEALKANGLFTASQAAVVEALRLGKSNKIIAYELNLQISTGAYPQYHEEASRHE